MHEQRQTAELVLLLLLMLLPANSLGMVCSAGMCITNSLVANGAAAAAGVAVTIQYRCSSVGHTGNRECA